MICMKHICINGQYFTSDFHLRLRLLCHRFVTLLMVNKAPNWLLSVGVTLLAIFHRKLEHLNGNSPTSCEK